MMKKLTTRAMALGMSVSLLMAGCMTAYADTTTGTTENGSESAGTTEGSSESGTTTKTYTITAPKDDAHKDHQYEIYQIFTGTLKENGKVLSNVKWGVNGKNDQDTVTVGDAVPETILEALAKLTGNDKAKLAEIEKYVDLDSTPVATVKNGETYTAAPGYYLIKDKDNSVGDGDTYTPYIVQVVADLDITPKNEVPSFEKKLKDTNDTTEDTSDWQDVADYDIGDDVPFQLKGIVAADYDSYDTYYFAFHDKEDAGLTFKKDTLKVYVNGTEISSGYELVEAPTDGCTFEVKFTNLKELTDVEVTAGSIITVEYDSELNENAKVGTAEGNVNEGKLEYSNNPNSDQGGEKGNTPWDDVIVFTYKVVVNKYANSAVEGNELAGAEFKLEKVLKDGNTKEIGNAKTNNGTTFTFTGLDDGDYILTETTTPEGYNTIDPIHFTVTADHKIEWNGEAKDTLFGENAFGGNATTGDIQFTATTTDGTLSTNVVNKSGVTLPSTGGVGTTMFYAIGGVLMAGAGILLVTRKRMEESEK